MLSCLTRTVPVVALGLALAGCGMNSYRASRTITNSTPMAAESVVTIDSRNGAVDVTFDDSLTTLELTAILTCGGDSQIVADERLSKSDIEIRRTVDNEFVIAPLFPDTPRGSDGARITLRLPATASMTIDTSNGKVDVRGGSGALNIDTSNGAVTIVDFAGTVHAESSNGRMTGVRVTTTGASTFDTSNGAIEITLSDAAVGPLTLDTSNGRISLDLGAAFTGRLSMDTSNGGVNLSDPSGRATSSNLAKNSGTVTLGDDDELSSISTSNGSITINIAP